MNRRRGRKACERRRERRRRERRRSGKTGRKLTRKAGIMHWRSRKWCRLQVMPFMRSLLEWNTGREGRGEQVFVLKEIESKNKRQVFPVSQVGWFLLLQRFPVVPRSQEGRSLQLPFYLPFFFGSEIEIQVGDGLRSVET